MWRELTRTLTRDLKPDLSLFSSVNKQTNKRGRERRKNSLFCLIRFELEYYCWPPKDFWLLQAIIWYSSKEMGLEWGDLCLRHSFPTKKLCVSTYDALFVILQVSQLKKGCCCIFVIGMLWGGYSIYMLRVKSEGREREHPLQGMTSGRPKSTLFCPLGYSKASQSFLRFVALEITPWSDDSIYVSSLIDTALCWFPRGKILLWVSPGVSILGQE